MHTVLSYNSEITKKKAKRNEGTNGQYNSKVRKIRKIEESKDQQEHTSTNRDEKKEQDENKEQDETIEVTVQITQGKNFCTIPETKPS